VNLTIFLLDFGTVPDSAIFLCFILFKVHSF
jgi:hypothetical protein